MTISYMYEIASTKSWSFLRIIFRWRGSIWKSVLTELFIWLTLYYLVFAVYRVLMNVNQQKFFAELANYTYSTTEYLPLTFMLGFFVKIVVDRWRDIFANIGFIDKRNILRYLCLTQVLVLRDTSIKVRRRFPTIDCVVQAGFLQPHELEMMDKITNGFGKYWIPINWACALAMKMREKGRINADPPLVAIMQAIADFKLKLQTLCNYDWVPVPIAYPQVVFLTIRVYFLICCISRQFMINESSKHRNIFDLYFPFMTVLQFIFYMGWLKVAEALLNPLGEDDDDFESNYIVDRNLTIALYMADECCNQYPEQKPDCFDPRKGLLYSEASFMMPNHALIGSAVRIKELSHLNDKIKMYPLCYETPPSYSANEDFTCDIPPLLEEKSGKDNENFNNHSEQYVTKFNIPVPDRTLIILPDKDEHNAD